MIGTLIGRGNTADVFDAGGNKAVKLFKEGYPLAAVQFEYRNSKLLSGLDIPIIQSYELVTYEGRHGIVYDRIEGESMLELLFQTEDLEKYTAVMASLHKELLACKLSSAVSLKSILKNNIEHADLSTRCKSELAERLEALPDGDGLCHGDFNFGNVMIGSGQNYIIDYMNICRGHQHADIARTVYLTEMTPAPAESEEAERILGMKKQAADLYLQEMGVGRESLSEWLLITAAARLSELSSDMAEERNTVLQYLSLQGLPV
ncbi:phosphotransferase [Paenibacillus albidus]|uniref:phosphotransferase n=1 Tax=Paenibacillus albidus TaxID=2041023 RepID=UPI001BE71102|nr:phosphotransferase [Paenibacillus albidus]MBT2289349.1 phosphotransferase [Paenibacillus albidus]